MATGRIRTLGPRLQKLVARFDNQTADRELLRRFSVERDETAFAEIVRRHGPMLLRVCQRILHNEHDAEDVCQAAFLLLAQKATSIRWRDSVAGWLFQTAYRLSLKARTTANRRRQHEARAKPPPPADPVVELTVGELQAVLDDELSRLPEKYRAPILLCCLEGESRDEAARYLGWTRTAVKDRLEQGRERLRARLARRGVLLGTALTSAWLLEGGARAGGVTLLPHVVSRAALSFATGQATLAGLLPARVAALAKGVTTTMFLSRVTILAVVGLALGVGAVGVVAWLPGGSPPVQAQVSPARPAPLSAKAPVEEAAGVKRTTTILDQALQDAEKVEDPYQEVRGLSMIARMQHLLGDQADCRKTLEKAIRVADAMPLDDSDDVRDKFNALQEIALSQSDSGDWDSARKTIEKLQKSKVLGAGDAHVFPRAWALMGLTRAQVKAGKLKEALETAKTIDDGQTGKSLAFVYIVKAQAKAKQWQDAFATAELLSEADMHRGAAFAVTARFQAQAGDRLEARKSLDKALAAANKLPTEHPVWNVANAKAYVLQKVAEVQSEMGDTEAAEQTLASIPEQAKDTKIQAKDTKILALYDSKLRTGDFKAALEVAEKMPPAHRPWEMNLNRDHVLAAIAVAQAKARDFKAAEGTQGKIISLGGKMSASTRVALELARAGQKEKAVKLLQQAVPDPETVGPDKVWADDMRFSLQRLAAAQAEIGEEKAALAWIAKLPSPFTRTFALLGVVEGLAAREGIRLQLYEPD